MSEKVNAIGYDFRGTMDPPRTGMAPLVVTLLILVTTSGCIDLELTRNVFNIPDADVGPDYHVVTLLQLDYTFDTDINDIGSSQSWKVNQEANVPIRPDTEWIRLGINVNMKAKPPFTVPNGTPEDIADWLEGIYNDTPRYVTVKVLTPHDEVWATYTFNNTATPVLPPIMHPDEGRWEIHVEAMGFGFQEPFLGLTLEDGYSVSVTSFEPKSS